MEKRSRLCMLQTLAVTIFWWIGTPHVKINLSQDTWPSWTGWEGGRWKTLGTGRGRSVTSLLVQIPLCIGVLLVDKDVFRFMLYQLWNPRILLRNRWVLSSNTQVEKLVFRAGLAVPNIHDISRDSHFCIWFKHKIDLMVDCISDSKNCLVFEIDGAVEVKSQCWYRHSIFVMSAL